MQHHDPLINASHTRDSIGLAQTLVLYTLQGSLIRKEGSSIKTRTIGFIESFSVYRFLADTNKPPGIPIEMLILGFES